jgi:hypothetical protein
MPLVAINRHLFCRQTLFLTTIPQDSVLTQAVPLHFDKGGLSRIHKYTLGISGLCRTWAGMHNNDAIGKMSRRRP